jgi:hypothetical protein
MRREPRFFGVAEPIGWTAYDDIIELGSFLGKLAIN